MRTTIAMSNANAQRPVTLLSRGIDGEPHDIQIVLFSQLDPSIEQLRNFSAQDDSIPLRVQVKSLKKGSLDRCIQCILPTPLKVLPPGGYELYKRRSDQPEYDLAFHYIDWDFASLAGLWLVAAQLKMWDVCNMVMDHWSKALKDQHMIKPEEDDRLRIDEEYLYMNEFLSRLSEQAHGPDGLLPVDARAFAVLWREGSNQVRKFWAGVFGMLQNGDLYLKGRKDRFNWRQWFQKGAPVIAQMQQQIQLEGRILPKVGTDSVTFCREFHTHPPHVQCYRTRLPDPILNEQYLAQTKNRLLQTRKVIDDSRGRRMHAARDRESGGLEDFIDRAGRPMRRPTGIDGLEIGGIELAEGDKDGQVRDSRSGEALSRHMKRRRQE